MELEIDKRDGYYGGVDDSYEMIGDVKFVRSKRTKWVKKCDVETLERTKKSIYEAKLQADYVILTVHSHAMGEERWLPADFFEEFCHFVIDNGADAVIGHGPHLLRPIEIYKGKPIFYSLGDFVLELYNVEVAPHEFYSQYGLRNDVTVHELMKTRSKDFTIGLMTQPQMFQTIIPICEFDDNGTLASLKIYPVEAQMTGKKSFIGLPRLSKAPKFMDDFLTHCEHYGTHFEKNEDGSYQLAI